jgi:hypothetical protein
MFYSRNDLTQRAQEYCQHHNLILGRTLGHGLQGMVFATDRKSAIKVHDQRAGYNRERDAYLRLASHKVNQILGHIIPIYFDSDDTRLIIEMSLVVPPFILDFGGAYLDGPASYASDFEKVRAWREEKAEEFGDNWPKVIEILTQLEIHYGIFISDLNSGNIRFNTTS